MPQPVVGDIGDAVEQLLPLQLRVAADDSSTASFGSVFHVEWVEVDLETNVVDAVVVVVLHVAVVSLPSVATALVVVAAVRQHPQTRKTHHDQLADSYVASHVDGFEALSQVRVALNQYYGVVLHLGVVEVVCDEGWECC